MKPTKKQLQMSVNHVIDKNEESVEDITIMDFLSSFTEPARALALGKELDLTLEECINDITEGSDGETYEHGREEYRVLTDSEADQANDECIENYIDDCILPELPDFAKNYFDNEAFRRDALVDGRGHNLAGYDGHENYQTVDSETYYIYRTN